MQNKMVNTVKGFLINKVNPSFIIIFGSYAKGNIHSGSDIDIAFFSENKIFTKYDLFMYAQELTDLLNIEVDLINLLEASTVFQAQIFTTGTVIYCKDENLRMNMQMTALSMYTKLNEERLQVLKNIAESGSVYGK